MILFSLPLNSQIIHDEKNLKLNHFKYEQFSYCSGVLNGTNAMLNLMIEEIEYDLINKLPYHVYSSVFDYQNNISKFRKISDQKLKVFILSSCNSNCRIKLEEKFISGWEFAIDNLMLFYDKNFISLKDSEDLFKNADNIVLNCSLHSEKKFNLISLEDF